jgi:hypothetical protein
MYLIKILLKIEDKYDSVTNSLKIVFGIIIIYCFHFKIRLKSWNSAVKLTF